MANASIWEQADDVLAHFGIKGMRWGVRRSRKEFEKAQVKANPPSHERSEDFEKSRTSLKKPIHSLSNAELKQLTERMQLEQKYKDLNKSDIQKGMKAAKSILTVAKTANDIYNLSQGPGAKKLSSKMKTAPAR